MIPPVWRIVGQIKTDLPSTLLLMIAGFGIGLVLNQLRPVPIPLFTGTDSISASARETSLTLPASIDLTQFQEFLADKRGIVFDVRSPAEYRLGHVPGALNLPHEGIQTAYRQFQSVLEKDRHQPLVLYCDSSRCPDARLVQHSLKGIGYTNVAVYSGGWKDWQHFIFCLRVTVTSVAVYSGGWKDWQRHQLPVETGQ